MPDKLGDSLKGGHMITPLNVERPKGDPGPEILNNPVQDANDPLGFMKGIGGNEGRKSGE